MNKPLSKEERDELEATYRHARVGGIFDRLIEAEAFWREAVKNADSPDEQYAYCVFCRQRPESDLVKDLVHTPDCPWKLAQE